MVARRLLILMLVMLVVASLSSVFLAEPGSRTASGPAEATTEADQAPQRPSTGEGRLVKVALDAEALRPQTIRLHTGDQLALRVEARRPGQVELAGLGQLEDVFPPAPARFNLYADREGRFPVRLLPAAREIGVIVVAQKARAAARR